MILRRFGKRLHHETPPWVQPGNLFHLRVRVSREQKIPLTQPALATALLDSASFYHTKGRWWLGLFLLMPDHWHALAAFPQQEDMSAVVADWKRWQTKRHQMIWQEGYFDHRIRQEESGVHLQNQADYILNNPVRAELCSQPEDWPWKIDHF